MKKYSNSLEARFTARHQKCIDLCGNVKNKTILNIGCFNGWFEQAMNKQKVKRIVGIDIDPRFLKIAKRNAPQANIRKMSALKLAFPKNSFDIVTMFDVIEHLPAGKEALALKEVYKGIKPKGKLIISTPNSHFFANIFDPAWYFGHRHYKKRELTEIIRSCGFEIDKTETKGGFFEIIAMILLYIFKWLFKREIPKKQLFDKMRKREYLEPTYSGFATLFVEARLTK